MPCCMIAACFHRRAGGGASHELQALVVLPTRDLALQVGTWEVAGGVKPAPCDCKYRCTVYSCPLLDMSCHSWLLIRPVVATCS